MASERAARERRSASADRRRKKQKSLGYTKAAGIKAAMTGFDE